MAVKRILLSLFLVMILSLVAYGGGACVKEAHHGNVPHSLSRRVYWILYLEGGLKIGGALHPNIRKIFDKIKKTKGGL